MPYTRCFRAKTACRFSEGSSRYRSCIKAKKPCDSVLVASTPTAAGRLSRIQKTQKLIRKRQAKTFRRSMQEVDKSDALELVLDTYKRGIVEELQFIQVPNNVNWSLYGLSDKFSDLGPLVQASGSKVSASRNSPRAAVRSARGS
ncbi:hypothetical protein CSPAE12_01787 [Colletotrichum incanum]|nr:hypothetical protein CSPAE12_01787 [Colletotrichum incanum]